MSLSNPKFSHQQIPQKRLSIEELKSISPNAYKKSRKVRKKQASIINLESDRSEEVIDLEKNESGAIEMETNFSVKQFLEFAAYHLVFFLLLGPLITIFFRVLKSNTNMARNMGFWGSDHYFIMQTMVFLMNFISLFGFLYFNCHSIHNIEIIALLGSSVIRTFVISTKYAYFSAKKCRIYRNKQLSLMQKENDLLVNWARQTDAIIEQGLNETIERNFVDKPMFKFFFLKPLKDEILEMMMITNTKDKNYEKNNNEESCWNNEYDGMLVAKFLIKKSKFKGFFLNNPWVFSLLLSFLRALIPIVYRIIETGSILGSSPQESIIILCIFISDLYFFTVNFLFIAKGIVEYSRLAQMLSQLTNLLSLSTIEKYKVVKEFPTINVFCDVSFMAWNTLNVIFRDYGRQYLKRIDIHLGIFLVYYSILAIIHLLYIYKILNPLDYLMLLLCGFEILVMFIAILILIWKGVVINDHYSIHRQLLNSLKDVVNKFKLYSDHYFEKETEEPENEIFTLGKEIIKAKIKKVRKMFTNDQAAIEFFLKKLIKINQFVQEQLTVDEDKRPFKVLGITANQSLFQKITAGLMSLATVGAQKVSQYF